MTLTEFLLARIAEDEARVDGFHQGSDPDFTWGPDRIRAECEAKRRIVVLHGRPHRCRMWDFEGVTDRRDPCDTLRAFGMPYADHPDYREEWKP